MSDYDARIARLPNWAQSMLKQQSDRIAHLEEEINRRDTGGGNAWTNAHVETTGDIRHRRFQPSPFQTVQFNLGASGSEYDWLQCRNVPMKSAIDRADYTGPRALEIMGYNQLIVRPRVSNVVWIVGSRS